MKLVKAIDDFNPEIDDPEDASSGLSLKKGDIILLIDSDKFWGEGIKLDKESLKDKKWIPLNFTEDYEERSMVFSKSKSDILESLKGRKAPLKGRKASLKGRKASLKIKKTRKKRKNTPRSERKRTARPNYYLAGKERIGRKKR